MAKFIYSYEKLLDIKQKLEKQEQMKMAVVMEEVSEQKNRLKVAKEKFKNSKEALKIEIKGKIIPFKIKKLSNNIVYYEKQVEIQIKKLEECEKKLNEARETVKKALRERKTYEILKQKAYVEYIKELKLEEAKTIDEINSFRYR